MRECHKNYAHGSMKLKTKEVVMEFRGKQITCEKTVYACNYCDFELFEEWMEEKLNEAAARAFEQTVW